MSKYCANDVAFVNKTSRSAGATTKQAIVPKYILETSLPNESILDFGAGKDAIHTKTLQNAGLNVVAYDFGKNQASELHDNAALGQEYDTVFASNVLNVQPNLSMFNATFTEMIMATKASGRLVVNYPSNPRHCPLTPKQLEDRLRKEFSCVVLCGGTPQSPLFEAWFRRRKSFRSN